MGNKQNVFCQSAALDLDHEGLRTAAKGAMETLLPVPLANKALIPMASKAQDHLVVGSQSVKALEVCNQTEIKLLPPLVPAVMSLLVVAKSNVWVHWSPNCSLPVGSKPLVELQCHFAPDLQSHGKVKMGNEKEMKHHAMVMLEFAWSVCTLHGKGCAPATHHTHGH